MNLPSKAVGWHLASIAAGAWGMAVFAQSNAVDLYAVVAQLKKTWGEVVVLSSMLAPFLAAGSAAYRTYAMKQVPKDAIAIASDTHTAVPVGAEVSQVAGKVVG